MLLRNFKKAVTEQVWEPKLMNVNNYYPIVRLPRASSILYSWQGIAIIVHTLNIESSHCITDYCTCQQNSEQRQY